MKKKEILRGNYDDTGSEGIDIILNRYGNVSKTKIEVIRCKGGWYFRIRARNGRILCHSEVYKTKQACKASVDRIVYMTVTGVVEK